MPRRYDVDWEEKVRLRDGAPALLRLVRPEDRDLLRDGFSRLSPRSRYWRFFQDKETLTEGELDYLTGVDGEDHVAVGALDLSSEPPRGLGVGRFVRLEDRPDTADVALAVTDDAQGKGLGTLLFAHLIGAARERGIARFHCDVLVDNEPMQELIEYVVPDAHRHQEDNVAVFEFALTPELETLPRSTAPYRLLRAAARARLAVHRALSWFRD